MGQIDEGLGKVSATHDDFPVGCALIVGAGGGIGRVVAEAFGAAGSNVALGYRSRADTVAASAETITGNGVRATTHRFDVTSDGDVEAAIADVLAAHGRIHTLVWAVGPLVPQLPLADVGAAQWRQAIEVETIGFLTIIRAVLPHLRREGGSIVHLGSGGDRWWPAKDGLSVVPKAANEALIRGIAKEEGRFEVRANSVLVGVIEAGMFLELSRTGVFDAAWTSEVRKTLCLKRWGRPEDIADAVLFLASRRANYITGQQLSVSGGFGV